MAGSGLSRPDWEQLISQVPKVNKLIYKEHPDVAAMTEQEVAEYRQSRSIVVKGSGCPKPVPSFQKSGLPDYLVNPLLRDGLVEPTAIQSQAIPLALSGKDLIGRAETGSGKTLAFLLPACMHISAQQQQLQHQQMGVDGPTALVLVPTRELALQIYQELEKYGFLKDGVRVRTALLYGGAGKDPQIQRLRARPSLIIATPGRLLDLLEMRMTTLKNVSYLVLDEADRMLEIGLEEQLRRIVDQIRPDRQTTMYSATWPQTVDQLAADYLKDPVQINVGQGGLNVPAGITQIVDVCDPDDRIPKLEAMLKHLPSNERMLIFTQTKSSCDELTHRLRGAGYSAMALHGDKSQSAREGALRSFRQGRTQLMVATDVAARGLDIRNVRWVVNYDFPNSVENYVHRIGRTGRAGAEGTAYSFFFEQHSHLADELTAPLRTCGHEPSERLLELTRSNNRGGGGYQQRGGGGPRYGSGNRYGGGGGSSYNGGGRYGGGGGPRRNPFEVQSRVRPQSW